MFFFNTASKQKNPLTLARSVLRFSRAAEEYTPWYDTDIKTHFKSYFDINNNALIEFEDEWSVIPSFSEFSEVYNLLWKRAEDLHAQLPPDAKKNKGDLSVKFTPQGERQFLLKPFSFQAQSTVPLNLSLTVFFDQKENCEALLFSKQNVWREQLDVDHLDRFLMNQATKTLREQTTRRSQGSIDSLIDILTYLDGNALQSDKLTAQQYLKSIWQVPYYVYSQDHEQGMMTRLRIQKSFDQMRTQLYQKHLTWYLAELLRQVIFMPFTEYELAELYPLVHKPEEYDGQQFLHTEFFNFYTKVLERCGVPMELSDLYGTDLFLTRVVSALSALPKNEQSDLAELSNKDQYARLLEDTIRFEIRNATKLIESPEKILRAIIKLIVRRLAEFQQRKKQSEQELVEHLKNGQE